MGMAESNIAPPMGSNEMGVPEVQDAGDSPELTEARRESLMGLLGKVDGKMEELGGVQMGTQSAIQQQRADAARELFNMMQAAGVDLTKVEEVSAFLESLKGSNPEMYAMLEEAINSILLDDTAATAPQEM